MNNIVKDIERNCPDCKCNTEAVVRFLSERGVIHYTAEHYREVWFFYKEACKVFGNKIGKSTTLEVMKINRYKFKYIRSWARRYGIS